MTNKFIHLTDSEFEELRKVFYAQAYETIEALQDSILKIETDPENEDILKAIKRYIHTLKGDSNSFGLTSVGTLCHRIEDMLSFIMDNSRHIEHEMIDLLLSCVDTINRLLVESEAGRDSGDIKGIMERIDAFLRQNETREEGRKTQDYTEYQQLQIQNALRNGLNIYEIEIVFHSMCAEKGVAALMIAKRMNDMGEIIRSVPEIEGIEIDMAEKMTLLFSSKLNQEEIKRNAFITGITGEINVNAMQDAGYKRQDYPASDIMHRASSMSEFLRVEASKVDNLMNLVGELIIGRSMIEQVAKEMEDDLLTGDIAARLYTANSYMERTIGDMQKAVMKMRMVPINYVLRRFPKIVRELSSEKGKLVRLAIYGRETELDKGIVDTLGEPLSHMIRNSIDHGIEEPSYRRSIGKPEEGTIILRAYHEAAHIVIEVSDDGGGIDTERLRKKAVEKGFLSPSDAERLSAQDAINLIFLSGLSTSENVSETSGRGVGMDVVKSAVEGMKGSIEVESEMGKGTTFRLRLPLTLAVIKALLFEVGERLYAIPLSTVSEITRIMVDDLITVDGRNTLLLRDAVISIVHLEELFRINGNKNQKKFVIILGVAGKKIGILVDRLIGQQDLVIKAVDEHFTHSGLITGASILGNGRVVLILDAPAIFKKMVEKERFKLRCHSERVSRSPERSEGEESKISHFVRNDR